MNKLKLLLLLLIPISIKAQCTNQDYAKYKTLASNIDNYYEYTDKFNNKEVEVLVEEFDEKTSIDRGHTTNYLDVKFENKDNLVGKVVKTKYKK